MDEHYNKKVNLYNMYGWEISYVNIYDMIIQFLKYDEKNEFFNKYNQLKIYD